jgi:hypothetical protein
MSDTLLRFIEQVALPESPPGFESATVPVPETFGSGQAAVVVGDHVAEFSERVGSTERSQVSDCLLFAQLAADHATKGNADLMAWYASYVDTLKRTGWTVNAAEMKDTIVADDGLVVHQAIVPVLTALLGPAAAAASMVVTVLKGLQEMDKDSPWITLFNRSSVHVSGAKLQFGFVDVPDGGEQVAVRLLAVALDAKKSVTQVLFFKLTRHEARLRSGETGLGMPRTRLTSIASAVADRVRPFLLDNIAQIGIG